MIKLPSGVKIKNLIDDLRIISKEASDVLLYYSQILKDSKNKSNILKNDNFHDPITIADLKVNEIIIQRINEKYNGIDWEILSEENVKIGKKNSFQNKNWVQYEVGYDDDGVALNKLPGRLAPPDHTFGPVTLYIFKE